MRVRGLKLKVIHISIGNEAVAPYAGAWIETHHEGRESESDKSHPMRVRGLKLL